MDDSGDIEPLKLKEKMEFQDMANELLLDLFELLDLIHLVRAFADLNTRFNQLLFVHFRRYRLNFQSISKYDFKHICQQYLPSLVDRIISFGLSNDDETPHLPDLFLSYGFTLDQFKYLQLLSLNSISSINLLNQLIIQCSYLQHLTRLYLIKCYFHGEKRDILFLMNNIWSLSKLSYCNLDCFLPNSNTFTVSTILSQSIEHLVIKTIKLDFDNLSSLFQNTPNLRRFGATISCPAENKQLKNINSSIISLKIGFLGSIDLLKDLFHNIKYLSYLTLETWNIYLNGYEWEEILVEFLPRIKRFQLKMNFNFKHMNHEEEEINNLLDSFRSHFWIDIRQQYFRCDWIPSAMNNNAIIYTLPYAFEKFSYGDSIYSKSTCSNEIDFWSYDRVQTVDYINNRPNVVNNSIEFHPQFPNIHHLNLRLLFQNNILSVYPSLNHLTTLDISSNRWFECSHLQTLLDRASHLYSLRLSKLSNLQMILNQIRSRSIRRLEFIENNTLYNKCFDDIECATLTNSSIGLQCEVLLIHITNRNIILDLINKLSNLRMLIIRCEDDKWNNSQISSVFDAFVLWLHVHLPSTCLITRDMIYPFYIQIWLDYKQQSDLHSTHTIKHSRTGSFSKFISTSVRSLFHLNARRSKNR